MILGNIYLETSPETFSSSTQFFSRKDYQRQWKNAIHTVLKKRVIAGLFTNIELFDEGHGRLWLFNLIPHEDAIVAREEDRKEGIYVTQQFFNVTIDTKNFQKRMFFEYEDGTYDNDFELSLYYLDLDAPEKFYGYLSGYVCGVSSWHFKNSDFEQCLENLV